MMERGLQLVGILFLLVGTTAHALSVLVEVKPNAGGGPVHAGGFIFDINVTASTATGMTFHVVITEESDTFHAPQLSVGLSALHRDGAGFSLDPFGTLHATRASHSATCDVTVSRHELDNPELVFSFVNPAVAVIDGKPVSMPSQTMYVARLKDFATPQPVASAPQASLQPTAPHAWSEIAYAGIPAPDATTRVPLVRLTNQGARGLVFVLEFSAPDSEAYRFPRDADIVVRLHRPNGQVVEPAPDGHRGQVGVGNAGWESHGYDYVFPWQENILEEAWIECRLFGRTYWVEVPYGFTRNPSDALPPIRALTGPPVLAPAVKTMNVKRDEILPWAYASYDLGQIQNAWSASVHVANPFNPQADIVIGGVSDLHAPRTSIEISSSDSRRPLMSREVGIRFPHDSLLRIDSFVFNTNGSSREERVWGTARVTVDDRSYQFTLPSSLFKYVHGMVEKYPKTPIPRRAKW
jgi:hypothetical protein